MLVPSPDGDITLDYADGTPVEHVVLGDIPDHGRRALGLLPARLPQARPGRPSRPRRGSAFVASFEYEFWIDGIEERAKPGSLCRQQAARPGVLIGDFIGALLRQRPLARHVPAGIGLRQFEWALVYLKDLV